MVELFARVRGETGPWLVMLHGLFGSADNLGGLVRVLEKDFRILLIDLRNHGRSPHSSSMTYLEMAADVFAAMDKEGIENAFVFGHSMGGKVAMTMALLDCTRIQKLIVGDIAPVAYGSHHDRIIEGMQAVANAAPQSRSEAQSVLKPYVEEDGVLSFLMTNWRRQTNGQWGWRVNLDAIAGRYGDIAAGMESGQYGKEVLFLRGENSDYIQTSHQEQILKLFPAATVKTIGGTGHWLHAEKPDLVARTMKRFLD